MKFISFFILCISFSCYSADEIITPNKEFPLEIRLIYQSLQTSNLSKEDVDKLKSISLFLDQVYTRISREDFYFVSKSEIYKTIIKFPASSNFFITPEDLPLFEKKLDSITDPFIFWIVKSTISDLKTVFSSRHYKEYLIQRLSGKFSSNETKRISKKIAFLNKLASFFNVNIPDNLKDDLTSLQFESLHNLSAALFTLSLGTASNAFLNNLDNYQFKYFSFGPPPAKNTEDTTTKKRSVEDIIDSPSTLDEDEIKNAVKITLPKPSNEVWIEENTPFNLEKLPKPTNDADWLQDI